MKPYVRGKTIVLREIKLSDAEFLLKLRTDPDLNRHLSPTPLDVDHQRKFILNYLESITDYYFIVADQEHRPQGTVRIYDVREDSFCWGSWILSRDAPRSAAIESALLIYDFAFFSLHYKKSHFDVRKVNTRVVDFHKRLGARIIHDDDINFYFEFVRDDYIRIREKYIRYLP